MNSTTKLMTLLLALLLPASAFALCPYSYTNYEFAVDGIYYKIVDNEACVTFQEYRSGMHLSDYHGDVVIPATVTYQDVTYPVTTIDYYAFNYCQGLTSITIPESITTIKDEAFYLCTSLACVNLLTPTIVIEKHAFSMCSALATITCPLTTPPAMYYEECFDSPHYESVTLHVPSSAVESYRNAPVWNKFVHIIGDAGGEAMAFDLEVDGIYYILNKKDATATVVNYSNSNVFIYGTPQYSGDIVIPEAVTDESGMTYAVTAIGNYAFSGCSDLSSVSLPNSIVTLGSHAFFLCKGLSNLSIPESVTTVGENCFDGCTGLTELLFPETLQSIGNEAFSSCVNLADIYIPHSLTAIGQNVFRWTAWFNNQPDGIIYAGPFAYTYKGEMPMNAVIDIKPGTKYIADYAFSEQPRVVQVIMPNSITAIGTRAFYFCTWLESIEMSDAITAIGYQAFAGCSSIQDFDFPNTLKSVGISAFGGTAWYDEQPDGLVYAGPVAYHYKGRIPDSTDFIIPDGTTSLGDGLFYGSERFSLEDNYEGLLSVTIPNSVRYIGDYAFLDDCTNLQTITIGSGVEDMGNCALGWVPNLTHVTISEGVKLIGQHMFSGCPNLKEIIIPNSVEVIKYRAFASEDVYGQTEDPACISLSSVTIGSGVTAIEEFAFSGCAALTEITCLATTPPVMENENCFDNERYETATLFVPAEVVDAYRNAPVWNRFVHIQAIDTQPGYEYVPFVREGVKWTYSIQDYHYETDYETNPARGDNKVYRTLEIKGDTVINGKTYKAVHMCVDDQYSEPKDVVPVYLREKDKMVYGIVTDSTFYDDAFVCTTPFCFPPRDVAYSGEEFLLYDFQDMVAYWDNLLIDDNWYNMPLQLDTIQVGGHYAKRYFDGRQEGDYFQVIEGIGATGMNSYPLAFLMPTSPGIHTDEYYSLEKVVENGEVIYPQNYVEDRYQPVIREGVKWVNVHVVINDGDTTKNYYTYEFKGNYPELDSHDCVFKAVYSRNSDAKGVGTGEERLVAGLREDEASILSFRNEPLGWMTNLINFYTYQGNDDVHLLHENLEGMWDIDYYINSQTDPDKNFLNTENFVKADPIEIDGVRCSRIAYIGEQGDTLAYLVEGIGFDSRDFGDLLTPFTRYPEADCGECYQEYCGLSHVIKDGKIIYKGMCYNPDVTIEIPGDVDGDGEVTIGDANSVIDVVIMGGNNGHTRIPAADVNGDGEVSIADVNAIIDIILKND